MCALEWEWVWGLFEVRTTWLPNIYFPSACSVLPPLKCNIILHCRHGTVKPNVY